ncbi:hypothetical protein ACJJI3_01410 [Microbulbifer sp. ZKSA004]|uniref:hypothetical protein n=1 Tax=Microbulbifer sp. ZKSA004 TaxID=3243389 RepID=UPI00403A257F
MTVATIPEALQRISTTEPCSPLAVFRTKRDDQVDVMFANTIRTQQRIEWGDINYLGSFHKESLSEARQRLQEYSESMREVA